MREVEASTGQRLLWLLDHYRGGSGMINVPVAWRIHGDLAVPALRTALDELTSRHEVLRTTYTARGRRLFQVVNDARSQKLSFTDLSHTPTAARLALRTMRHEIREEIDPRRWPLRVSLWRIREDDHLLLVSIHHLATDFASNAILTRDLSWLYDRAIGAGSAELPIVTWSYADWSESQREAFAQGQLERLQTYWQKQLDGVRRTCIARTARSPAQAASARDGPGRTTLDLDPEILAHLQHAALLLRTTTFPLMLAAFYAYLHSRSGESDLAVSTLLTNRNRPEVKDTVGFFANMVMLRVHVNPDAPFASLVYTTRETFMEAMRNGELPLHLLPAGTAASADEIVFQYLVQDVERACTLDYEVLGMPTAAQAGRFALELVTLNGRRLMLRYGDRYNSRWASEFLAGYVDALVRLAGEPELPLAVIARRPCQGPNTLTTQRLPH